jgi:hypothetical protein
MDTAVKKLDEVATVTAAGEDWLAADAQELAPVLLCIPGAGLGSAPPRFAPRGAGLFHRRWIRPAPFCCIVRLLAWPQLSPEGKHANGHKLQAW